MGVSVKGEGGGIVSGVLLDGLHIVSGAEGIDHIGVPQIVESVSLQSGSFEYLLENFPHAGLGKMAPIRVGEDQVGKSAIIPGGASRKTLHVLLQLVLFQNLQDRRRGRDGTGFIILQRGEMNFFASFSWLCQLLGHSDQPVFKIYAVPSQTQ